MNSVTLDRKLADVLLVLMHRVYSGEVVPPGQWRLFMTDLENAIRDHDLAPLYAAPRQWKSREEIEAIYPSAPRTHEVAPGSTQEPEARQPLTLAGAIALVSIPGPGWPAHVVALACSACQQAPRLPDRDFCGPCQNELNADLAALHDRRQSGHPGSRCNAACGHCGRCG